MTHRTARGLAALTIASALLLSACGSSDDATEDPSETPSATSEPTTSTADADALAAVTVTGDAGAVATLSLTPPVSVTADAVRVLDEGTGDEIAEGNLVAIQTVVYTGSDGKLGSSSWEGEATEVPLDGASLPPVLEEALVGTKVGTRLLYAQPIQTQEGTDTALYIVDTLSTRVNPTRAEGEAVTPPEGLPTVTLDETGKPSLTIPDGYTAPTELVAQTLIKGDGPVVESGQIVAVQYTGWKLSDGSEFATSWGSKQLMATLGTGAMIAGWDQGLVGQTVGSQVLLVVPKALAYGDSPSSELKDEDLVFVVDILRVE